MPAPIVKGLVTFLEGQLNPVRVWDSEVPREDEDGNAISPQSTTPGLWPALVVDMSPAGFQRDWTFEGLYAEEGDVCVYVFGTTRLQVETVLGQLDTLFSNEGNWGAVGLALGTGWGCWKMLVDRWTCVLQENTRLQQSTYCYAGELWCKMGINGIADIGR